MPAESELLSAAFQRNDPFETLPPAEGRLLTAVSFDSLHGLQTNLRTGSSLPVRRVHARPPLWEARIGQASWVPYAVSVCTQLETAWQQCYATGSVDTPAAFVDLHLAFANGFSGQYRISFRLADGVQEDGRRGGLMRCVRRTPDLLPSLNVSGPVAVCSELQAAAAARTPRSSCGGTGPWSASRAWPASAAQAGPASAAQAGPASTGAVPDSVFRHVVSLSERCCICLDEDARDDCGFVELSGCGHGFHEVCIRRHLGMRPACPLCFKAYGLRTGNQPPGEMNVSFRRPGSLPLGGHERDGTIVISYNIPNGIQGAEHPNPGRAFAGARRIAYLPDTRGGREVLRLLKEAFDRKLIFTVGRSVTSGRDNCVTWSSVHHKTSPNGGQRHYGWPDPGYLNRVTAELAALGVD
jgi:deltex